MSKDQQTFTSVTATGHAETAFKSAAFSLTITERGKHNLEARKKVDVTYSLVKKAIAEVNKQGAGIDDGEEMKVGLSTSPWQDYDPNTREQIHKGYQVTASLNFSTEKVDKATLIMDALTKIDGATVQTPSFTPDDAVEYRQAAAEAAYARAMEDFRLRCAVLGESPDSFEVTSCNAGSAPRHHGEEGVARAMAGSAPAAPPTEIKAGRAEISVTLTLTFARRAGGRTKPSTRASSGSTKSDNGKPTRAGATS